MEYRGVKIDLNEYMPGQLLPNAYGIAAEVIGSRPAFVASSPYGVAIATRPQQALDDAKALINAGLLN